MCFIAMPFGRRPFDGGITLDFDRVHFFIRRGAEEAGLEAIRADFEPAGGFIHNQCWNGCSLRNTSSPI